MQNADATTGDPDGTRTVLCRLLDGQRQVLGDDLVGLYLFGSAATGTFEPEVSDVDTVAVLRSDLTDEQLHALGRMHQAIENELPEWDGRVEVVYLSSAALRGFRAGDHPAARISPGESFHAIWVDPSWLIDWYPLQEVGVVLTGPPVASLVPSISREEYVEAIRRHLMGWRAWAGFDGGFSQAYTVLTACRGLRTVRTGELVSKREAATWAIGVFPEDADLIRQALAWRDRRRLGSQDEQPGDPDAARRFVQRVAALAAQEVRDSSGVDAVVRPLEEPPDGSDVSRDRDDP